MKKLKACILVLIMVMNMSIFAFAENETTTDETYATGLIPITEEELEVLENSIPQIIDVKPNALFYERLQSEYSESFSAENIMQPIAEYGEEIVSSLEDTPVQLLSSEEMLLPTAVDNSALDNNGNSTFPTISSQDPLNACVGWSFGYYQLTNNANRIRGTVARNSNGNIAENVYSPNWVYNLGSNGTNNGMSVLQAMNVLYTYGCPTTDLIPINTDKTNTANYKTWYPEANIWENALYNKCDIYYGSVNPEGLDIPIDNSNSTYIHIIKEVLANGYVATFETAVYATDDSNINEIVKVGFDSNGNQGYAWIEFRKDGEDHALTVIGYDDNFYVDINGNGEDESAEYGAFKVANSWGTNVNYHNEGYFWIPYDALNKVSAVKSENHINRKQAIDSDLFYLVIPKKNYEPLLLATLELQTSNRSGITVTLGVADTEEGEWLFEEQNIADTTYINDDNIETSIFPIAFNGVESTCNLIGTNTTNTGTLVFDLTGVLNKMNLERNSEYIFYLKFDNIKNTKIKSLSIKDLYNEKVYVAQSGQITNKNNYSYVELEYISDIMTRTKDYTFFLNFNNDVLPATVNDKNISIIDSQEQEITVNVSLSNKKKYRVLVEIDENVCACGFYNLLILPGLKSKGGNGLKNAIEEQFYIPFH